MGRTQGPWEDGGGMQHTRCHSQVELCHTPPAQTDREVTVAAARALPTALPSLTLQGVSYKKMQRAEGNWPMLLFRRLIKAALRSGCHGIWCLPAFCYPGRHTASVAALPSLALKSQGVQVSFILQRQQPGNRCHCHRVSCATHLRFQEAHHSRSRKSCSRTRGSACVLKSGLAHLSAAAASQFAAPQLRATASDTKLVHTSQLRTTRSCFQLTFNSH